MTNTRETLVFASGDQGTKAARRLRILIADDDRDVVLTLMMILQDEGHEITAVYSGRNVVSAVIRDDPDVVVIDINMPDMSGWQAAQTIRARREKRPLLIGISGVFTKTPDKILGHLSGFDHYLVKPCAPADLLALIAPLKTLEPNEP